MSGAERSQTTLTDGEVDRTLAAERGLMTLPGPFFGPGQDRHLRLAFANAAEERLAELPARLGALG